MIAENRLRRACIVKSSSYHHDQGQDDGQQSSDVRKGPSFSRHRRRQRSRWRYQRDTRVPGTGRTDDCRLQRRPGRRGGPTRTGRRAVKNVVHRRPRVARVVGVLPRPPAALVAQPDEAVHADRHQHERAEHDEERHPQQVGWNLFEMAQLAQRHRQRRRRARSATTIATNVAACPCECSMPVVEVVRRGGPSCGRTTRCAEQSHRNGSAMSTRKKNASTGACRASTAASAACCTGCPGPSGTAA